MEILYPESEFCKPDYPEEMVQVTDSRVNSVITTGSPHCQHRYNKRRLCRNRSVPGHVYCGPHGGKLTLRSDGTIGIIGPGCYRAIASLAKLNHRYVSQVLQGKSNPTSNVLDKIAKVVGVEVGWLMDYIKGQKTE